MLLTPVLWANRTWALPLLTALVPSQRYNEERGHRHKSLTDWAQQMFRVVQRWCPGRQLIVVADSAYAVIQEFTVPWQPLFAMVRRLAQSHPTHFN